jgi:hypothetical protein
VRLTRKSQKITRDLTTGENASGRLDSLQQTMMDLVTSLGQAGIPQIHRLGIRFPENEDFLERKGPRTTKFVRD